MMNNGKKHIYFSVDSDLLRLLTYFFREDIDIEEKMEDPILSKNKSYLTQFKELIDADIIRLVIVNSVYQENKHSRCILNFVKKYMYAPDINFFNALENSERSRALAMEYCRPYFIKENGEEKKQNPPMRSRYNAGVGTIFPPNDAFIVAESTICNALLLTLNGKDMVFDKASSGINYDRADGIEEINKKNGYCYKNSRGFFVGLKPLVFGRVAPKFKSIVIDDENVVHGSDFPVMEDKGFVKNSDLLK